MTQRLELTVKVIPDDGSMDIVVSGEISDFSKPLSNFHVVRVPVGKREFFDATMQASNLLSLYEKLRQFGEIQYDGKYKIESCIKPLRE